jgi:hypothetical protein
MSKIPSKDECGPLDSLSPPSLHYLIEIIIPLPTKDMPRTIPKSENT